MARTRQMSRESDASKKRPADETPENTPIKKSPKVDRKDAAAEEATLSIQRNIDTIFAALAKKDEEIKELQDELPCDDNASGELKKDTEDLKYEMEVAKEKIQELEVKVADMEEKLEAVMVEDKTYTF